MQKYMKYLKYNTLHTWWKKTNPYLSAIRSIMFMTIQICIKIDSLIMDNRQLTGDFFIWNTVVHMLEAPGAVFYTSCTGCWMARVR